MRTSLKYSLAWFPSVPLFGEFLNHILWEISLLHRSFWVSELPWHMTENDFPYVSTRTRDPWGTPSNRKDRALTSCLLW